MASFLVPSLGFSIRRNFVVLFSLACNLYGGGVSETLRIAMEVVHELKCVN